MSHHKKPTAEQVQALADAMWQLLDDMGHTGLNVCLGAKAQARYRNRGPIMTPELKEKIARAIEPKCKAFGGGDMPLNVAREFAQAALTAIEEAGYVVVPREQWAIPMPVAALAELVPPYVEEYRRAVDGINKLTYHELFGTPEPPKRTLDDFQGHG